MPATSHHRFLSAREDFQRYILLGQRSAKWTLSKGLIQRVAEDLVHDAGLAGPPIDPLRAAQFLGIAINYADLEPGMSGNLVPTKNGFSATISSALVDDHRGALPNRSRFTIAHECGHSLFYSQGQERMTRLLPIDNAGCGNRYTREEGLCDDFARAMLLPQAQVFLHLPKEPDLPGLLAVARKFQVAPAVLVRRILYDLGLWPDAMLYHIWPEQSINKARRFHGKSRSQSDKQYPSAPALEKIIAQIPFTEVAATLRKQFQPAANALIIMPTTIWMLF